MRNNFIKLTIVVLLSASVNAQTDSLVHRQQRISVLEQTVQAIKTENNTLKSEIVSLKQIVARQKKETNDLRKIVTKNSVDIAETAKALGVRITETNMNIDNKTNFLSQSLQGKTTWGIVVAMVVLIVSLFAGFWFHRTGSKKIQHLKEQADKLNERIVGQFSSEMIELQKISSSINTGSHSTASSESEQALIKALADRITFMEMTLYRMDKTIRGHKQLSRSITQMKNNMLANGYEMVDMLGKPYHEGMKVIPNFVDDENIEKGTQVITALIKPQINYKGEMIQSAQITVSQNL